MPRSAAPASIHRSIRVSTTAASAQARTGWTSGPDDFELEVGNLLAYSSPLWVTGGTFSQLQAQWLPYYGAPLRRERLAMVRGYFDNNLDHIPLYVAWRALFQAFSRFYHAFGEFLQALFIARRVYPIAYNKWVREQIEDILGLPELYVQLPRMFEIEHFESEVLAEKGAMLRARCLQSTSRR